MKQYISINGYSYVYYEPTSYEGFKKLKKRIKEVKEKLRAKETGYLKDKNFYSNYSELLIFLETLLT
jgi:hypothetical protein